MDSVGIRELKTHLSRHLKRVQAGERLLVTERGRSIATISPVDVPADVDWAHQLVVDGRAHWNGAKPTGAKGTYVQKVSVSSTMGPGVRVDLSSLTA